MELATPLEERIREAVQQLLEAGDPTYLQELSRIAFIDALENELRFLGMYRHNDHDTPARIHTFVEEHADQWRLEYLLHQQDIPEPHIEIEASPFAAIRPSATVGILKTKVDYHINLISPAHDSHIQISPNST